MPRFDQAGIAEKLAELIRLNLPEYPIVDVSVRESRNFEGEPSLAAEVIFRELPKSGTSRPMARVLDQFRSWLSAEKDEERFPYIRVLSEQDKRELQEMTPESGPAVG